MEALFAVLLVAASIAFAAGGVRRPRFAGSWYDADAARLRDRIDLLLGEATAPSLPGRVVCLVAPHAGIDWSGSTAAAAYAAVAGARVDRVVVLAPSHHVRFVGARVPDWEAYATPLGEIPVDRAAAAELGASLGGSDDAGTARADAAEHAVELQLPFLQRALGGFRLVPVLVGKVRESEGGPGAEALAARVRECVDDRTLVVSTSDFTHYGEAYGHFPFPPDDPDLPALIRERDGRLLTTIEARDAAAFDAERVARGVNACGADAIAIALGVLPRGFRGTRLRYASSADRSGDWSSAVSYAAVAIAGRAPIVSPAEARACVALARQALEAAVSGRTLPDPDPAGLPRRLRETGAAFVTLRRGTELRGCVGHVSAREPLWRSIVVNARAAAISDERFAPVGSGETGDLRVEVTILGAPARIERPDDLLVGEEGAILRVGEARAVFLPRVAEEQGWSRTEFLEALARKAGLPPGAWAGGEIESFAAVSFAEAEEPRAES